MSKTTLNKDLGSFIMSLVETLRPGRHCISTSRETSAEESSKIIINRRSPLFHYCFTIVSSDDGQDFRQHLSL